MEGGTFSSRSSISESSSAHVARSFSLPLPLSSLGFLSGFSSKLLKKDSAAFSCKSVNHQSSKRTTRFLPLPRLASPISGLTSPCSSSSSSSSSASGVGALGR